MLHINVSVTLTAACWVTWFCSLSTGGDISTKNLWLAESVLDILLDQKYVFCSVTLNSHCVGGVGGRSL